MTITVYTPSPPLDAYIKCFWYSNRSLPTQGLKILSTPSLHLMVNFSDAYQVYAADQTQPFATCAQSWSVGLWDRCHIMDPPPDLQILNISFKPGGAYPFLPIPLVELHNQIVSLDAIWGAFAAEIRERLYAEPTTAARFALLEKLLVTRLRDAPPQPAAVQFAVAEIARQHGALSIGALSDQLGLSQKHLSTQFKQMVGSTPKTLARIYRFRHVLDIIDPTQPVDWTQIAHQARYYDQAHFNKDFEAFTGHSPGEYLRLRRQFSAQSPEFAQYPQYLITGVLILTILKVCFSHMVKNASGPDFKIQFIVRSVCNRTLGGINEESHRLFLASRLKEV
ncbi:MAG: helix-turn-helix domain-containing protein [Caldilineaceae bacterium]